jgi:hypothetical protein
MGLGGQGESADRIEYSLSPVVPKEKEFPVETIGGRLSFFWEGMGEQLLYSFLITQSTSEGGWIVICFKKARLIVGHCPTRSAQESDS